MENIKESAADVTTEGKNFFQYVFNFDSTSQCEIYNMLQYAVLAIIPVVILNKSVQKFVPEADDSKGSFPILAEIILQMFSIFLGIFFIHRIVTFIPTLSKCPYKDFNFLTIIIQFLVIVLSLQTKLGEKVNILVERIIDTWEGNSAPQQTKQQQNAQQNSQVRVSQPISSQGMTTSQLLPPGGMTGMPSPQTMGLSTSLTQPTTDFGGMYQNTQNQLVNAASPGSNSTLEGLQGMEAFEPMAANEGFGGFTAW